MTDLVTNSTPDPRLTDAEWKACRRAYNSEQNLLLIALPNKVAIFTRQMDLITIADPSFIPPNFVSSLVAEYERETRIRETNDREFALQLRRTRIAEDNPNPSIPRPRSGSLAISIDLELEL